MNRTVNFQTDFIFAMNNFLKQPTTQGHMRRELLTVFLLLGIIKVKK